MLSCVYVCVYACMFACVSVYVYLEVCESNRIEDKYINKKIKENITIYKYPSRKKKRTF